MNSLEAVSKRGAGFQPDFSYNEYERLARFSALSLALNEGEAMPNNAEMAAYAARLPPIYRDIMTAFPAIDPGRKAGDGLAFQTLAVYFANTRRGQEPDVFPPAGPSTGAILPPTGPVSCGHNLGEVQEACKQLADGGFFEIKNGIFAHPTDLGEQLIAAVTGRPRASSLNLPKLPARTW